MYSRALFKFPRVPSERRHVGEPSSEGGAVELQYRRVSIRLGRDVTRKSLPRRRLFARNERRYHEAAMDRADMRIGTAARKKIARHANTKVRGPGQHKTSRARVFPVRGHRIEGNGGWRGLSRTVKVNVQTQRLPRVHRSPFAPRLPPTFTDSIPHRELNCGSGAILSPVDRRDRRDRRERSSASHR